MSLITLREAIRAKLETEISVAKAYTHGGRFDNDELKRWAVQAPCIIVGALDIPEVFYESGQLTLSVQWGAFVVAKDGTQKRDAMALMLAVDALGVITPIERWNDDSAGAPGAIKASNLYSGKLDNTGVALWAITWTQDYDVQRVNWSELDDFLTAASTVLISDNEDTPEMEALVTLEGP